MLWSGLLPLPLSLVASLWFHSGCSSPTIRVTPRARVSRHCPGLSCRTWVCKESYHLAIAAISWETQRISSSARQSHYFSASIWLSQAYHRHQMNLKSCLSSYSWTLPWHCRIIEVVTVGFENDGLDQGGWLGGFAWWKSAHRLHW